MVSDFTKCQVKLFLNGFKYRYLKARGKGAKPIAISIAVTGRCNSHCIICSMWKLSRENPHIIDLEMTKDEIIDFLSRPLFSGLIEVDLTGGEPHLRDDLGDIVLGIAALKKTKLKKLRTIIVPSNGLLTETIVPRTRAILAGMKGSGVDYVPVCSLDGIGKTHDIMRGTKGAFDKELKTIEGLLEIRKDYPDFFWPGIKTTITHTNVDELDLLLDFAVKRDMFHIISAVIITAKRFRNIANRDKLELSQEDIKKIARFYNNRKLELDFYYSKVFDSITSGKKKWICTSLTDYVFIDYDRKVYPCPVFEDEIGDLNKATIEEIWNSKEATTFRKKIGTYPICLHCTEPGSLRYSQVMEGFSLLSFMIRKGKSNFEEIIFKKGLQKLLYT